MELSKTDSFSHRVVIVLCSATLLIAYYLIFTVSVNELLERWLKFDEAYSHGLLIFGIALYLLFIKRAILEKSIIGPGYFAFPFLIIISFISSVSIEAGIDISHQLLAPAIIWFSFTALLGYKFGLNILIPLIFLYYAIPVWDYLTFPLQSLTVVVCDFLLDIAEIPAFIEGVNIHLPSGIIKVAGGCSGLRYLLVGLTISSLYAVLFLESWQRKVLLIISGVLLALLANWLRVFIIIVVGHRSQMTSPLLHEHDHFGWLIFALTLTPLFVLGYRLQARSSISSSAEKSSLQINDGSQIKPPYSNVKLCSHAALIILFSFYAPNKYISQQNTATFNPISLEKSTGNWKQTPFDDTSAVEPILYGFEQQIETGYTNITNQGAVNVQLNVYPIQNQQHELIQYHNRILDEDKWKVLEKEKMAINNVPFVIAQVLNRKTNQIHVIFYSYYVSGDFFSDDVIAKLASLKGFINGRRDGTVLLLNSICNNNCNSSQELLTAFIDENLASIKHNIDAGFH